jgi:hypothetical protein
LVGEKFKKWYCIQFSKNSQIQNGTSKLTTHKMHRRGWKERSSKKWGIVYNFQKTRKSRNQTHKKKVGRREVQKSEWYCIEFSKNSQIKLTKRRLVGEKLKKWLEYTIFKKLANSKRDKQTTQAQKVGRREVQKPIFKKLANSKSQKAQKVGRREVQKSGIVYNFQKTRKSNSQKEGWKERSSKKWYY